MEVIYIMLAVSLLLAVGFLVAFLLNIRSGQYDDTVSPGVRILFDDIKKEKEQQQKERPKEEQKS